MAREAAEAAKVALLKAIEAQANLVTSAEGGPKYSAPILRDLAVAYRAVYGGPQPGNVVVEK